MILFVNACVRSESRTRRLAEKLLSYLGDYEEINLAAAALQPLNEETLNVRNAYIEKGNYENPMFDCARQFAAADVIVIAAPYWDMSFPAILKTYLENIYVTGIVSRYGTDGRPEGLCNAGKLFYVTTAGGPYIPDYSYKCLQQMATQCFGIPETKLISAEMLDVEGFDPEEILSRTETEISQMFR